MFRRKANHFLYDHAAHGVPQKIEAIAPEFRQCVQNPSGKSLNSVDRLHIGISAKSRQIELDQTAIVTEVRLTMPLLAAAHETMNEDKRSHFRCP